MNMKKKRSAAQPLERTYKRVVKVHYEIFIRSPDGLLQIPRSSDAYPEFGCEYTSVDEAIKAIQAKDTDHSTYLIIPIAVVSFERGE